MDVVAQQLAALQGDPHGAPPDVNAIAALTTPPTPAAAAIQAIQANLDPAHAAALSAAFGAPIVICFSPLNICI